MNLATANAVVKKVVKKAVKASKPTITIQAAVDQLGVLQAEIHGLQAKEKALKEFLKRQGDGDYDGTVFHAVVTTADQERISPELVRELVDPEIVEQCTKTITVTTLKVTALSTQD